MARLQRKMLESFFQFKTNTVELVLPSFPSKRERHSRWKNYPSFRTVVPIDDVHTAVLLHGLISHTYASSEIIITPEKSFQPSTDRDIVHIGGPPTNKFIDRVLRNHNARFRFCKDNYGNRGRAIRDHSQQHKTYATASDNNYIVKDYCLISRFATAHSTVMAICGLRAFAQQASYIFLNNPEFYYAAGPFDSTHFQVLVDVEVCGSQLPGWDVVAVDPEIDRHVFISYKKDDLRIATEIEGLLRNAGFKCWIDERNIKVGSKWTAEIEKAIERAFCVVLIVGENGLTHYQDIERKLAVDYKRKLIPTLLSTAPDIAELDKSIQSLQTVHLFTDLLEAVKMAQNKPFP